MADGEVCVSETTVVFQTENVASPRKHRDSFRIPTSPSSFQGAKSQANMNPSESEEGSFFPPDEKEESNGEDDYASLPQPRKKRRLTLNQVEYLEKKFEVENKLEPERKVELAKRLGLQPRQVAIWFQNRRARLKTKQLERDYDELKCSFERIMSDYDNLLKENDDLKIKINEMKEELLEREKKTQKNDSVELLEAMAFPVEGRKSPFWNSDSKKVCNLTMAVGKQEEASSNKSDVFYSESPFNADNHSSLMEAATSSQSEFSQDEEDNLTRTLFPSVFPNLEEDEEFPKSCSYGFLAEEQAFCFWPYFSSDA